jgi:hypothetical protein
VTAGKAARKLCKPPRQPLFCRTVRSPRAYRRKEAPLRQVKPGGPRSLIIRHGKPGAVRKRRNADWLKKPFVPVSLMDTIRQSGKPCLPAQEQPLSNAADADALGDARP